MKKLSEEKQKQPELTYEEMQEKIQESNSDFLDEHKDQLRVDRIVAMEERRAALMSFRIDPPPFEEEQ